MPRREWTCTKCWDGILPFYFKKADSHVSEKLSHTVKNHLFLDFRAFCCRCFMCRIPMEARYGQRKTNVYNLRGSLSFTKYFTVLGITETKEILVRNVFLYGCQHKKKQMIAWPTLILCSILYLFYL